MNQAYARGAIAAADQLGGPNGFDLGCYVAGNTVITPPASASQGNTGRNVFRGPRFTNWDFSLSRAWKLHDRIKLQLRG